MVKYNHFRRKLVTTSQCTVFSKDLCPEVSFSWASVYTHHQEKQLKHQNDEIPTNVDQFPGQRRGYFEPILPLAKAILHQLVHCCVEFLTIKVTVVSHVLFPKRPFECQITDSINATIDQGISLLRANALLFDVAQGLANLPEALPHFIIYPLCCQATLIMPSPHGVGWPLADPNTGVLGPDANR